MIFKDAIPERDDMDEPATKGDVIRLYNEIIKWRNGLEKEREKDIKSTVKSKIERHIYKCPSHSKADLKERGLIEDAGDFIGKHPIASTGSISTVIAAAIQLLKGLL